MKKTTEFAIFRFKHVSNISYCYNANYVLDKTDHTTYSLLDMSTTQSFYVLILEMYWPINSLVPSLTSG